MAENKFKERRKHRRFPAMHNLLKPIDLIFEPPATFTSVPAILLDLSAGGLGMLTFVPIEAGTEINAQVDFKGLNIPSIQGKVVSVIAKGESWRISVRFKNMENPLTEKLNKMAEDYNDCETKIALGAKDVCFDKCLYFKICEKQYKLGSVNE
jgi:hypothetical protein